jgi:hypothetical protein
VGKVFSALWGIGLVGAALGFHAYATGNDTPVVVLALSIASVTYGALLGTYILAGRWPRALGRDVVLATGVTLGVMLVVIFARPLSATPSLAWLEPVSRIAWPWYVPIGTSITLLVAMLSSLTHPPPEPA